MVHGSLGAGWRQLSCRLGILVLVGSGHNLAICVFCNCAGFVMELIPVLLKTHDHKWLVCDC